MNVQKKAIRCIITKKSFRHYLWRFQSGQDVYVHASQLLKDFMVQKSSTENDITVEDEATT